MYTYDETGVMNNYAVEPKMYFAVFPSPEQQRQYLIQGVLAVLLVTATILTAFVVS
ncbi:MAG: ssl1498 family light-harvesting-like protein [Aphanocapsa sp. GSE-SYN-MK-11-07L]|nr:ssl1498 family light-harvesting-like protein [Aphanocapsa sp. GSE-SYN-MK-11-07L]